MKIQYIGIKRDGETAFKHDTRITWYPGDVNDVQDSIGVLMLRHPDVFVEAGSAPFAQIEPTPALWSEAATELGMTDGNVEAIASKGGPETAAGAALWLHYTGKAYEVPEAVVKLADAKVVAPGTESPATDSPAAQALLDKPGNETAPVDPVLGVDHAALFAAVLEKMDKPALHALAKEKGLDLHPNTGAAKLIEAIVEAQAKAAQQ